MLKLEAVITLPKEKRVVCQHEGCGRHVFAKVHVIRQDGKISFVGSTCFRKLFGDLDLRPSVGGEFGIALTEEEREQILNNTESFLAQLKARYEKPTPQASESEPPAVALSVDRHRGKPTHVHLFRCLTCSTQLFNYEFESTERICPQCDSVDDVFTIEKFPI